MFGTASCLLTENVQLVLKTGKKNPDMSGKAEVMILQLALLSVSMISRRSYVEAERFCGTVWL